MKLIALAVLIAGTMSLPLESSLAQEASEQRQNSQELQWQNPDRIADIQDKDERIRAFSVLIGQSVYDEMLKATDGESADAQWALKSVNIVDVTEALEPADVRRLESAAAENESNIKRLQSYLELTEETRSKLEEEDVLPASVVGIQRIENGVLDILVVPNWLLK